MPIQTLGIQGGHDNLAFSDFPEIFALMKLFCTSSAIILQSEGGINRAY